MPSAIRGHADHWIPGDWNASCYVCGRKYKASEMVQHWQGYYVCQRDYESRQPQDFVRGIPDQQTPPWVQTRTERFTTFCTPNGRTAIPGEAQPNCVIPAFIDPVYDPDVIDN